MSIRKNQLGDTRTAYKVPTISQFNYSNTDHCDDVHRMMVNIANDITDAGGRHDFTKCTEPGRSLFYRELCDTIEGKMKFEDGEWLKMHYQEERHHLNDRCPDDITFVDIIEMICDCVCAGMARTGEFKCESISIDDDVLAKAFKNTVQICIDSVELIGFVKKTGGGEMVQNESV